jgi:hypothetical protein
LKFGECAQVPPKSIFIQGPEASKQGIKEGHDVLFLPTRASPIPMLPFHRNETALAQFFLPSE